MKRLVLLPAVGILILSLALATTRVLALDPAASGGTPGPPAGPTPTGTWLPGEGYGPPPGAGQRLEPLVTPGPLSQNEFTLRHGRPAIYRGEITAVDLVSLTLALTDGSSIAFVLTPGTRIKVPGPRSQGDTLLAGMHVIVQAFAVEGSDPVARSVMAIPGQPTFAHRVGTVTAYAAGASITIQAVDGNTYTFGLSGETRILPQERASSLALGSRVTVVAPRDPAALGWVATGIVVHPTEGV